MGQAMDDKYYLAYVMQNKEQSIAGCLIWQLTKNTPEQ